MRILFVTNDVPYPPDNGVRIVSHHAMRLMHRAGHQLALAVLTEDSVHAHKYFKFAAEYCLTEMAWWVPVKKRGKLELLLSSLLRNRLVFIERYASQAFRAKLCRLIDAFKPDVIHFDLIPMTQYIDTVPKHVGTVASINDSWAFALENGLEASKFGTFEHLYRKYELLRVKRYERNEYPKFDVTHVMSDRDKAYLSQLNGAINTSVISNGVDPSLFEIADLTYGKTDILFLGQLAGGNLHYLEQFLNNSWPIIRNALPQARLNVVGRMSSESKKLFAHAERYGGVVIRGYIEKLTDAYSGCGLAIVPIDKACGILNKAIEAMAAGLVAVGFERSFAGIPHARSGVHHIAARDYQDMGRCIIELLKDSGKRCSIQKEAHRMAKAHYSWDDRCGALEQMYSVAADRI